MSQLNILERNAARIEGALKIAYHARKCSICEKFGACPHREPELELALLRANRAYIDPPRKSARRETRGRAIERAS